MRGELRPGDPERVGPYRLVAVLGSGGMGRVYLARSAGGRPVAVKVIRPELAQDAGFRDRFRREVAAARRVNGFYTAVVVDADVDGPAPWLATEHVDAPDLRDAVGASGPLPASRLRSLAAGLTEGLAAIHGAGLVHRDLKPSNVLLAADGPRIIDFGIAWTAGASPLTGAGVVGSPEFMSPEQAEPGRDVGPPSDVFSLGALLCFAATGRGPWGTGDTATMIDRVANEPPDLSGVPGQIRDLVARCLAPDPAARPAPAQILAELGAGGAGARSGLFAGEEPRTPVVAGEVPQAPPAFQPRADLMAELRAAGPGVSVVRAVTGMRGVGKTQLAAAYARQCRQDGWRLVAWVNAEDTPGLLSGMAVVGDRLGIDPSGKTLEAVGGEVRNRLEADGDHCLLVFDNVTDFAAIAPYVPALGAPQVVLTTTEAAEAGSHQSVQVGVFSEEEALAFLAERTGRDDPDGALALCRELGCLPLALAQAAAVIAAQRLTYPRYLARLRAHPAQSYLQQAKGDPYPRGVAEAVLLSADSATQDDPSGLCRAVLDTVALLSPEGVSRQILYQGVSAGHGLSGDAERNRDGVAGGGQLPDDAALDEGAVDEVLGRLAVASLLTFSGDDRVLAHRLVMRVLRERALNEGTLPGLAAATTGLLAECRKPIGDQPWERLPEAREWVRQVTALADHLAPVPGAGDLEPLLTLRAETMEILHGLRDSAIQAIEIGEKLAPDCERALGADHLVTLGARGNLAYGYLNAGRLAEAAPLLEATTADCERVLGGSHPETQAVRNNLGMAYMQTNQLDKAVPLFETVVADSVRVLGPVHPDTLATRNNLTRVYRSAGRIDEALELTEALLSDDERVLGPSARETLRVRNNLALLYRDTGRLDEAVRMLESVLADRERQYGSQHPETLTSQHNVARGYLAAGRPATAAPLLEAVLADAERILGPVHELTLESRCGLALAYRELGQLDLALPLFERAVAEFTDVIGPDSPRTARVRDEFDRARALAAPQG